MIRVLTIDPQASTPVEQPDPPTLEQLYEWVGVKPGFLEMVSILCGDGDGEWCQLWVDEEGKIKRKPINKFATVLLRGHFAKHNIVPDDVIVGNAVLLCGEHLTK